MTDVVARLSTALADRYRIERELGQGGMATVYLAHDIRHDRKVALKVLKPELAAVLGADRFLGEIKTTAGLQHPHILPLFDSGQADGRAGGQEFLYYVMPYVEGETLRSKLDRETQLGIDEAVRITTQVADALDYAHRHGVIHRDIKPENILLHDGRPMVADFGIALALSAAAGGRMTETGLSLGTPHYLSPEQAAGARQIDSRSDIYSLAAVMYEMLAGQPPHVGPTVQALISKVMTEDPRPIDQLRRTVPDHVSAALDQALAKVPADRFSRAGEFAEALAAPGKTTHAQRFPSRRKSRALATVAVAGVAAGVLLGFALTRSYSQGSATVTSAAAPLLATIDLPPEAPLALDFDIPPVGYNSPMVALSEDGSWLAWVARTPSGRLLYVRNMATGQINPLPGTEGANHPFFSPDAEWVGFLTADRVKRVPRRGGAVITLCEATTPVLAWWQESDVIYFTERETTQLSRVTVEGRKKDSVFAPSTPKVRINDVLAGGEALLLSQRIGVSGDYGNVLLHNLRTHTTDTLVRSAYAARVVGDRLVFARAASVMAVGFDPKKGRTHGQSVPIVEGVTTESLIGTLHIAPTRSGVLAFVRGGDLSVGKPTWVDRRGHTEAVNVPEQVYGPVDLTPDKTQLAVQVAGVKDYIWVWDLLRGEGRRVVSDAPEGLPHWSPDGRRLASADLHRNQALVRTFGAGGPDDDARPVGPPNGAYATGWSRENVLALSMWPRVRTEFIALDDSTRTIAPVVGDWPTFSPDGAWLVVVGNDAGSSELFLRSFPSGTSHGQLTTEGGTEPRWLPSGNVVYRNGRRWYSTRVVTTSPQPRWDRPQLIFDTDFIDTPGMSWDISADEQRLLVVKRTKAPAEPRLGILTNWMALTDRRP